MSHLVDRPEVEKGDLGRSRSVSAHVYQDFMNCHIPPDLASCLNTLPVPISRNFFFFALCCLGKIPGGAPFSQLHKSGNGSRVDRP